MQYEESFIEEGVLYADEILYCRIEMKGWSQWLLFSTVSLCC